MKIDKIKITKNIEIMDQYGVTRLAWIAGEEVEPYIYNAILARNSVVNPEDLPEAPGPHVMGRLISRPIEHKMLVDEPEAVKEAPVQQVEPEPVAVPEEVKEDSAPKEHAVKQPNRKKKTAKPKKG